MANIKTAILNGPDAKTGKIEGMRFSAAVGSYGAPSWTATVNVFYTINGDPSGIVRRATDTSGSVINLNTNEQGVDFAFFVPVTAWLQVTSYTSGQVQAVIAGAASDWGR